MSAPPATKSGGCGAVRGNGNHDPVADLAQDIEAPFDHRTAAKNDERLGPGGPKAFAAAGGGDDPDDGHMTLVGSS